MNKKGSSIGSDTILEFVDLTHSYKIGLKDEDYPNFISTILVILLVDVRLNKMILSQENI